MELSPQNAVKYYIGDVREFPKDDFWNDPKAYLVLNSLFYPGTATEQARTAEGKFLNPEILADTGRLSALLKALLSAFQGTEQELQTFRVERFSDFRL